MGKSKQQLTPKNEPQEIDLLSGQRQNSESDNAILACNEWLRMGAGRSLSDLLQRLTDTNQISPITTSLGTIKHWSADFNWTQRAIEYDALWEQRKNTEREAVLNYGLSLDYERLRKLQRLANMLEAQIYERSTKGVLHNLWLPDVRSIGSGENAERVDIEKFNAPLLEQYRKVLDDIAKETGGRVQNVKVQEITWRDQAIADIKAGEISYDAFRQAFDDSLASELFAAAGVPVSAR